MADFIAVIRRAVDGLAENTPDMRAKVYERARGAVQRQLENMKPRPPEAMLQRQLEKLEAAIREVDAEHAQALPADNIAAETYPESVAPQSSVEEPPAPAPVEAPIEPRYREPEPEPASPDTPSAAAPVAAPEPVRYEPEPPVYAEPHPADLEPQNPAPEDLYAAPEREAFHHVEEPVTAVPPQLAPEPVVEDPAPRVPAEVPAWLDAQEPVRHDPDQVALAAHEAAHVKVADGSWQEPAVSSADRAPVEPPAWLPADDAPLEVLPAATQEQPVFIAPDVPDHEDPKPIHAETGAFSLVEERLKEGTGTEAAAHFEPVWNEPAVAPPPAPPAPARFSDADWAEEELRLLSGLTDPVPAQSASPAPRSPASPVAQPAATGSATAQVSGQRKMPSADGFSWEAAAFDDLPPIGSTHKNDASNRFPDDDILADIKDATDPGEGWKEAAALRDYDRRGVVAEEDGDGDGRADLDSLIASKMQGKSFRVEPKRRFRPLPFIIFILLLLALAGGGYAAWQNRDELTAMLTGLVRSVPIGSTRETATPPPATTQPPAAENKPAGESGSAQPSATPQSNTAALNTPSANPTPASVPPPANVPASGTATPTSPSSSDPSLVDNKFTQRLMADGTEVDSGPATVGGTLTAEGKSVAQQNVASADPLPPVQANAAGSASAVATAAAAAQPPADTSAAAPAQPAAGAERVFLYEEKLGEGSPASFDGTVTWSVQNETGENGRAEPSVQAMISIPSRDLTAMVTFKRNDDPEFKASHLVEVVFSLKPSFEGGSINSVQRINMKNTEQERGDELLTGSAKITDDFYMFALNNDPEARTRNLALLSSRDWIDIPVTYRNGRRALFTFQKGASGKQAFDTAMQAWAAMGGSSNSQ